jgi:hypothetical protein
MSFGKKLGAKNSQLSSILENKPLNNGFNKLNYQLLNESTPLSLSDKEDLKEASNEAKKSTINSSHKLQKPNIPENCFDCETAISVVDKVWRIVTINDLYSFYTQDELQKYVDRACLHDFKQIANMFEIPTLDMAIDLAILSLYDIILLLDDSGSMDSMEDGLSRFVILTEVCKTISFFSTLMDDDGISVRFLHDKNEGDYLKTFEEIQNLMSKVYPTGSTPLGKKMKTRIFERMISNNLTEGTLKKPVLLIVITDGIPDSKSDVINTIKECREKCISSIYGENAMAFSFVQIGTDRSATKYLDELDNHPIIGKMIDCTSCFEIESKQCLSRYNVELTPGSYLIKLLLGPIDPNYDEMDEINEIPVAKSSVISSKKSSISKTIKSIFSF